MCIRDSLPIAQWLWCISSSVYVIVFGLFFGFVFVCVSVVFYEYIFFSCDGLAPLLWERVDMSFEDADIGGHFFFCLLCFFPVLWPFCGVSETSGWQVAVRAHLSLCGGLRTMPIGWLISTARQFAKFRSWWKALIGKVGHRMVCWKSGDADNAFNFRGLADSRIRAYGCTAGWLTRTILSDIRLCFILMG